MSIIYFKILRRNHPSDPTNSRIFTTAICVSFRWKVSASSMTVLKFHCSGKGDAYTANARLALTGFLFSPLEGRPKGSCSQGRLFPRALPGREEPGWGRRTQWSQILVECGAGGGGPLQAPSPSLTGLQAGRVPHCPSLALMEFQGQWPVINISPKLSVSEAPCPEDFFFSFFLKAKLLGR